MSIWRFAPPGVIYAMNVVLRILTKPGDRVMVPMPNYDPLFDMVTGAAGSW